MGIAERMVIDKDGIAVVVWGWASMEIFILRLRGNIIF